MTKHELIARQITLEALRLYNARKARDQSAAALLKFRQDNGGCERIDDSGDHGNQTPCYHQRQETVIWCQNCIDSQPIWMGKRLTAIKVGTAMRRLMFLCRKAEEAKP